MVRPEQTHAVDVEGTDLRLRFFEDGIVSVTHVGAGTGFDIAGEALPALSDAIDEHVDPEECARLGETWSPE